MKAKVQNAIVYTGIGLCIAGILALVMVLSISYSRGRDMLLVVRTELCASVCVQRGAEFHKAYEQRLGFGAEEWRCGCSDGHVQVIP